MDKARLLGAFPGPAIPGVKRIAEQINREMLVPDIVQRKGQLFWDAMTARNQRGTRIPLSGLGAAEMRRRARAGVFGDLRNVVLDVARYRRLRATANAILWYPPTLFRSSEKSGAAVAVGA